jgi:hypothetical protein
MSAVAASDRAPRSLRRTAGGKFRLPVGRRTAQPGARSTPSPSLAETRPHLPPHSHRTRLEGGARRVAATPLARPQPRPQALIGGFHQSSTLQFGSVRVTFQVSLLLRSRRRLDRQPPGAVTAASRVAGATAPNARGAAASRPRLAGGPASRATRNVQCVKQAGHHVRRAAQWAISSARSSSLKLTTATPTALRAAGWRGCSDAEANARSS